MDTSRTIIPDPKLNYHKYVAKTDFSSLPNGLRPQSATAKLMVNKASRSSFTCGVLGAGIVTDKTIHSDLSELQDVVCTTETEIELWSRLTQKAIEQPIRPKSAAVNRIFATYFPVGTANVEKQAAYVTFSQATGDLESNISVKKPSYEFVHTLQSKGAKELPNNRYGSVSKTPTLGPNGNINPSTRPV